MATLKERVTGRVERLREDHPGVDHAVRTVGHYGAVDGNAQAGAVTFFGFLSFFPILALAFFVVGILAHVYPELRHDLRTTINGLLPGVIGNGPGKIPMKTFENAAGAIGLVGLVGVLYSGLGWLSGMRAALEVMFAVPKREQPGFVKGKLLDLGALALVGTTLLVSVMLSAAVAGFSATILGWAGVDPSSTVPNALLWVLGHALAIAATAVLFATMFKLLVESHVPRRSLWEGALLGAVGFELLKGLANFLLGQTQGQEAFQAFGVALIVVVWINYFSRLVMYAASYAYTSSEARERRAAEAMRAPGAAQAAGATTAGPELPDAGTAGAHGPRPAAVDARPVGSHRAGSSPSQARTPAVVAGGLIGLAAVGAVASRRRKD